VNGALLEINRLSRHFVTSGHTLKAIDDLSLSIQTGEVLGIVGESGSGKTTLGRVAMRLLEPTAGSVLFEGRDIWKTRGRELKAIRRRMQMVFQDPFASLNPRMTIGRNIEEPLIIHRLSGRAGRRPMILEALDAVNLPSGCADRYPHELSGGQRQRAVIARALALKPALLICDEAVSALDVSVQAQILNLLTGLKAAFGLSYMFIAHGLNVVRHISDRVAVMYMGQIVECSETNELFDTPRHPYTEALISSIPDPDAGAARRRIILKGDIPSLINPPAGCRFHTRCIYAQDLCSRSTPSLGPEAHPAACHFPLR